MTFQARRFGRKVAERMPIYLAAIIATFIFLLPIIWIVVMSFKTRLDIFVWPPKIFDFSPTLHNYVAIFSGSKNFAIFLRNSLVIAGLSTLFSMLFGVTAAFALAKRRVAGSPALGFVLLSFRMMPPIALILPYYILFRFTGLLGTIPAIALSHTVFSIAIVIWMMRSFFEEVPGEIEEAALIDGASPWMLFWRVTLPMSRPAVAAAAIFAMMTSWNEFIFAVVLSNSKSATMPVAVSSFIGEVYVSWGELAAATTVGILPTLLLAFLGQRYLIRGLTIGGVK